MENLGGNFPKRKKRPQSCAKKIRIVTIEIVIKSIRVMGIRVTISCRYCTAFEVMLLFPVFFCHASSPEHRAFEGCIVPTSIALPFIARFRRGFQLFHKGLLFQMLYIVLIFVARWRHNFREIAVKNCEKSKNRRKSLCAPLRIDS